MPIARHPDDEFFRLLAEFERRIGALERAQLERWHLIEGVGEPAFANGWFNLAGDNETAAFHKDPFGRVWIRGLIGNFGGGGNGNQTVVFTLPDGYRPAANLEFAIRGASFPSFYMGIAEILMSGTVTVNLQGLAANAAVDRVTIGGSFRVGGDGFQPAGGGGS